MQRTSFLMPKLKQVSEHDESKQVAGDECIQIACMLAVQTSGNNSLQYATDLSVQKTGAYSLQISGNKSDQTAGNNSIQITGDQCTQTAGVGTVQTTRWLENQVLRNETRDVTAEMANQTYYVEKGKWTKINR